MCTLSFFRHILINIIRNLSIFCTNVDIYKMLLLQKKNGQGINTAIAISLCNSLMPVILFMSVLFNNLKNLVIFFMNVNFDKLLLLWIFFNILNRAALSINHHLAGGYLMQCLLFFSSKIRFLTLCHMSLYKTPRQNRVSAKQYLTY